MDKRPALGKGLSALIPDAPEPRISSLEVDVDRLAPNDLQPRGPMDPSALEDLSRSIVANGIIQPIVVRRVGDRFQIIAGERRWRAAKLAGLLRVPVVVRDVAPGGERSLLEQNVKLDFQRTGSYHLLVVSGMAVAILAFSVFWLARILRLPDPIATVVSVIFVGLYVSVTDLGAPVLRAALMCVVYMLARLLYRFYDVNGGRIIPGLVA